jgi:hypothetical protein
MKAGTYKHSDETKKLISEMIKVRWSNPDYRSRAISSLRSGGKRRGEKVSLSYTPERKEQYSQRLKKMWKEEGGLNPNSNWKEDEHPAWKGNDARYEAIHIRMRKKYLLGYCEICKVTKTELKESGRRGLALHCVTDDIYIDDASNWKSLCCSCHTTLHHRLKKEEKMRKLMEENNE